MIVELFGPPAAGKTTLTQALLGSLEKSGHDIQLVVSSRPAERSPAQGERGRAVDRRGALLIAALSRASKLASALDILLSGAGADDPVATLLRLLPPRNPLWRVRYRRYLSLLSHAWKAASASDRITIIDQGFVTALCSLAVLARSSDRIVIARCLKSIPRPDILVCLDAPREILEARLRERLRRQGTLERLFEFDIRMNLEQMEATREVTTLLRERAVPAIHVSCLDHRSLKESVDRITLEIAAKLGSKETEDWPDRATCRPSTRRQDRDQTDRRYAEAQ